MIPRLTREYRTSTRNLATLPITTWYVLSLSIYHTAFFPLFTLHQVMVQVLQKSGRNACDVGPSREGHADPPVPSLFCQSRIPCRNMWWGWYLPTRQQHPQSLPVISQQVTSCEKIWYVWSLRQLGARSVVTTSSGGGRTICPQSQPY